MQSYTIWAPFFGMTEAGLNLCPIDTAEAKETIKQEPGDRPLLTPDRKATNRLPVGNSPGKPSTQSKTNQGSAKKGGAKKGQALGSSKNHQSEEKGKITAFFAKNSA